MDVSRRREEMNQRVSEIVSFLDSHVDLLEDNNFDELLGLYSKHCEDVGIDTIFRSSLLGEFLYKDLGIKFFNYANNHTIPSTAFYQASYLPSILELPSNITRIGYRAFCESSVEEVTFHGELKHISPFAFMDSRLKSIIIYGLNKNLMMGRGVFDRAPLQHIRISKNVSEHIVQTFLDVVSSCQFADYDYKVDFF